MTADAADPRAVVSRYIALTNELRIDEAFELVHPDARIWISGRLVASGEKPREVYKRLAKGTVGFFPDGYVLHVTSMLGEGSRVAAEAVGDGVTPSGARYQPAYATFYEVVDGTIREIREYIDTEYVAATFGVAVRAE